MRHNTGNQQSLPHTGYQHGTALGTRSVLQETSSKPGIGQGDRRRKKKQTYLHATWLVRVIQVCALAVYKSVWDDPVKSWNLACCVWVWPAYLLLVQLEGGLDQIPQGSELLLLLVLSLFDLRRTKVEDSRWALTSCVYGPFLSFLKIYSFRYHCFSSCEILQAIPHTSVQIWSCTTFPRTKKVRMYIHFFLAWWVNNCTNRFPCVTVCHCIVLSTPEDQDRDNTGTIRTLRFFCCLPSTFPCFIFGYVKFTSVQEFFQSWQMCYLLYNNCKRIVFHYNCCFERKHSSTVNKKWSSRTLPNNLHVHVTLSSISFLP